MPAAGPFIFYWNALGLPLSRAKGAVVDRVPFSMVEATVWVGLLCLAILVVAALTRRWAALRRRRTAFRLLVAGPALLLLLSLGQGAFPLSMSPTAWRQPLARAFPGPALPYDAFSAELRARENRLHRLFIPSYYQGLPEEEAILGCDTLLDGVLRRIGLPAGRAVRRAKDMGPLTTVLGLSYGGPAFHDPFWGELAIAPSDKYPAPRYWRLLAACHEAAHAKGFTREMDAEILTHLALSASNDPRYTLLGDIMFLRKSGERIHLPEALRREIRASRDSIAAAESRQPAVRVFKSLAKRLGFQNNAEKYGTRDPRDNWNPRHPFYSTVAGLEADAARSTKAPQEGGTDAPAR